MEISHIIETTFLKIGKSITLKAQTNDYVANFRLQFCKIQEKVQEITYLEIQMNSFFFDIITTINILAKNFIFPPKHRYCYFLPCFFRPEILQMMESFLQFFEFLYLFLVISFISPLFLVKLGGKGGFSQNIYRYIIIN